MSIQPFSPIGIFDSGLGGLSICKEIIELLPNENIIYLADSKNTPYGQKNKKKIIDLSIKNTQLLITKNCKLIVVACNTATTNAITLLRKKYDIPFIGIEPAIKPAALNSKTHKIGILATKGTLNSELFQQTSQLYRDKTSFVEVVGDGLVPLIEQGKIQETKSLLKHYLAKMMNNDVDKIVLGCSHYPFLIPVIQQFIPKNIQIIDSGRAVAKQTKIVLEKCNLLNTKLPVSRAFYTNCDVQILTDFLKTINITPTKAAYNDF